MQDAAGAWIKTAMARFIMLGGHIRTPRNFFEACEEFLTSESNRNIGTKKMAFTAHRKFVLLEIKELAKYRNEMSKVPTWEGISSNKGWFAFYPMAGMKDEGEGFVCRQWLACLCKGCRRRTEGEYDEKKCENAHLLIVDGVNFNKPEYAHLQARTFSKRTKEDELKDSHNVSSCLTRIL